MKSTILPSDSTTISLRTAFNRSSNSPRYLAPATRAPAVEARKNLFVLQPFGHVTADDALRQALDDGGLAHAGLADETGLFFVRRESPE